MLPFVQLAQFREIRPHIRFAHYTDSPMKVPSRYIRDHELIFVDRGRGTVFTELGAFPYEERSLLMVPPGVLHSFKDDLDPSLEHAHWAFTKLRMEKAALLLLSTKLPVQEIAYACGYEDSKYFSRLFRQYEGFSPIQYSRHFLRAK